MRACTLSRSVMSDSLQPHGLQPARLLCPLGFSGKITGMGCHALLQGIFPTQGLNPGILHCRWVLYCLSHQGSPNQSQRLDLWPCSSLPPANAEDLCKAKTGIFVQSESSSWSFQTAWAHYQDQCARGKLNDGDKLYVLKKINGW